MYALAYIYIMYMYILCFNTLLIACTVLRVCTLLFLIQSALRQITDKAREFGADSLFNQILPLLMSPTLG